MSQIFAPDQGAVSANLTVSLNYL